MLTRSGWSAMVLAGCLFVIGRLFGIIELYIIGAGLIAAVVWAVAQTRVPLPEMKVQRLVAPAVVQVGSPARVSLTVSNVGRRRSPTVLLWEPAGGAGNARMHLAPLRVDESAVALYRLPTATRGVLTIGPMRIRRNDTLGLAVRTKVLPGTTDMIVTPQFHPIAFPSTGGSSGRLADLIRTKSFGQASSEFHSLRPYVAGDDLRKVSWKASARTTELIVKEHAVEGLTRCTVVLDTDDVTYDNDRFERAVSVAASVVSGAVDGGVPTRLLSIDIDLRGPEVVGQSLRWLAGVHYSPPDPRKLPTLRTLEGLGLVVVIAGSPASARVSEVAALIGPEEILVVVATGSTDSGSTPGSRFVVDATTDDSFAQSWAVLTGRHESATRLPAAYGVDR